ALLEAAQLKKTLKKSKLETHKHHASGSGDGGDSDDDINDDSDDVTKHDDDDVDSDADGDNKASDSEKTDSNKDENANLNQNEDEEEEYKEEYVHTPNSYGFTDDEEEYEDMYKDVNVRLKATEHEEEGKGDAEMTNAGHADSTEQTTYEQVKYDKHVILTTIHDTQKTEVPLQSSSISSDFANQFLNLDNVPPTDSEVVSIMNVKKAFRSYTADFKKNTKDNKKRYIDLVKKSVKDIIKDEVKSQLPHILPKEVSKFTTPVIQSTITESHENVISKIAKVEKSPLTFNELMSTPIEFSAYVINNLKINNLTQEHLVGPAFNLLKGTCKNRGCQVVPVNYFINNDLEYLKGGSSSMKYTTYTTKIKAAKYDDIQGIEDMVPSLWSPVKSKHDVFSTKTIIAVIHVKVMKWYDYGYLEEIEVRREDQQLYKFREGDFPRLNLCDIKDMMLLKLSNMERDVIFDLNVALQMFIRRVVILKRVEDLQLGVKSYQKKLNITKPKTFSSDISNMTPYTAYNNPQGIIYLDKLKRNKLMRSDELYKFRDDTLTFVRSVLYDIASSLRMDYLPKRK
ncbi:hypothetical protein Tco_0382859, partial [Tanacetum coccineum]